MIDPSELRYVQEVVCHQASENNNCPDGVAAAMIIRRAYLQAGYELPAFRFVQYGSPWLHDMPARPHLMFVDITPPAERADEFFEARSIILDHHVSARSLILRFAAAGLGVLGENERQESGAMLAYRHIWQVLISDDRHCTGSKNYFYEQSLGELAELVATRDTWHHSSPKWEQACELAAALAFIPAHRLLQDNGRWERYLVDFGPVLRARHLQDCQQHLDRACQFSFYHDDRVMTAACFSGCRFTSDALDLSRYDLVIGFSTGANPQGDGQQIRYSLRSKGAFDCAAFAQQHGGGGHVRAAGFHQSCEWNVSPYTLAQRLVRNMTPCHDSWEK